MVETIIETIKLITSVEFIEKWQTLYGSFLGPFLAIILSAFAFYVKDKFQKHRERKEAIRRAEIAFSQTLTRIQVAISQIEEFIGRVKKVIAEIKKIDDEKSYDVRETNFPATVRIYFDEDLIKMKFKSYYLHNKILITDYLVESANGNIQQFRYDFERLLERNERLAEKMPARQQRESYVNNLEGFVSMIEKFINNLKTNNAESIAQAKVYNLKLMNNSLWTIWKYEGTFFKYFKNKEEMKNYNQSMEAVDRINEEMKKEAVELMQKVRDRAKSSEE